MIAFAILFGQWGFEVFFHQLLSESFGNITDVSGPSSGEAHSVI